MKIGVKTKKIVKEQIVDRVDQKTTSSKWKKARNIAGIVAAAGGLLLIMPVNLPASVIGWVQWGVALASFVSGGSALTKTGKR